VDGDPQQLKLLEAQGWHYRYRKSGTNSKDVFFSLESYSSKLKNGPKNPEWAILGKSFQPCVCNNKHIEFFHKFGIK
jgi:hypothetical protein